MRGKLPWLICTAILLGAACTKSAPAHDSWEVDPPKPMAGLPDTVGKVGGTVREEPQCSFSTPACGIPGFVGAEAVFSFTSAAGTTSIAHSSSNGYTIRLNPGSYTIAVNVTDARWYSSTICPKPIEIEVVGGQITGASSLCSF